MKYFYLLLLICAGCTGKTVPSDVIPKEKMEKILWELLEADEWAFHNYQLDTTARKQAALAHYERVFQINGIDAATFRRSYDYYSDRPTLLAPVLDSVRNRATPPGAVPDESRPRKGLRPL